MNSEPLVRRQLLKGGSCLGSLLSSVGLVECGVCSSSLLEQEALHTLMVSQAVTGGCPLFLWLLCVTSQLPLL